MTLPAWTDALYASEEMRTVDAWAVERGGVPSEWLMERAGEGLARVVAAAARPGPIRVVAGKGNNGGDGLVVARLLQRGGRDVRVLLVPPPEELEGDAAANLHALPLETEPFAPERLEDVAVIVDAVLGTGVTGAPREPAASVLAAIDAASAPVVAADVPSGVDASTGEVAGAAVHAIATATFAAAKPGLWINPGKEHAGRVEVVDIGLPAGAPAGPVAGLIGASVLDLIPRRTQAGTKFTSGHVIVAGGSRGLTGAPTLSALGAMRAGAGYVTVLVPGSEQPILAIKLTEAMSRALPDRAGHHVARGADAVVEATGRGGSLVLGPGIGRDPEAQEFARTAAARAEVALVLDADGLNAHAGALESLAARGAPTVLTPHEGELARLLDIEGDLVAASRLLRVREAAQRSQAIVVLKGDDTIVAAPDGTAVVNPLSAPMLATAGTGDVLGGVIGALLAKGMEPFEAASLGVLAHVRAGFAAADRHGADHVIAGDVIDSLPDGIHS